MDAAICLEVQITWLHIFMASGVSKPGGGGFGSPHTLFCIKQYLSCFLHPFSRRRRHKRQFSIHIPKDSKAMLQPAQLSRIPKVSQTLVTRPLHLENRFGFDTPGLGSFYRDLGNGLLRTHLFIDSSEWIVHY